MRDHTLSMMRAIGHRVAGPITAPEALVELTVPRPVPGPRDLLVAVRAVSVNPVDVKVRAAMAPEHGHRILGYDAAGVVEAVGAAVTRFRRGDEVFYAGDITRPGSNAEFQVVDERIVGHKPRSLDFETAAAMPLTSITAWEILFDSFRLREGDGLGESLLVIGGAGGVGSILIQLARQLTRLNVIATASRPETMAWVERMGAQQVVDHRQPLEPQLRALGVAPRYVAALTHTERHFASIVELIAPRGIITLIDDPAHLDARALKPKALTLSWEFMFARSMFGAADLDAQHRLLQRVSALIDGGHVVSTVNRHGGALNVDDLRRAHEHQESGAAIGKTVLGGFAPA